MSKLSAKGYRKITIFFSPYHSKVSTHYGILNLCMRTLSLRFKNQGSSLLLMGGKSLKFPRRKKYVPQKFKQDKITEEETISEEEHKKRIAKLREIGLLK